MPELGCAFSKTTGIFFECAFLVDVHLFFARHLRSLREHMALFNFTLSLGQETNAGVPRRFCSGAPLESALATAVSVPHSQCCPDRTGACRTDVESNFGHGSCLIPLHWQLSVCAGDFRACLVLKRERVLVNSFSSF